jgi:hypothetical protein
MITITTKNAPKQLVEKINTFIKDKRITTWDIDNENDWFFSNFGTFMYLSLRRPLSAKEKSMLFHP